MLPLLVFASDGEEHRFRDTVQALAEQFRLSEEDRLELLPSGRAPKFANRVGWSATHLSKAELIERPRRGYFTITERGLSLLKESPDSVNLKLLDRYPEHVAFRSKSSDAGGGPAETDLQREEEGSTPAEAIDAAYGVLRDSLAEEVLQQIKGCSPEFFERLVVDLLVGMGYGGTRADAGRAVGKSGDGGIDGIINEDRLGLDVIYIQAKRWEATVGRPEIQQFAGALQGQKARKGVFITTSGFSKNSDGLCSEHRKQSYSSRWRNARRINDRPRYRRHVGDFLRSQAHRLRLLRRSLKIVAFSSVKLHPFW